MDVYTGKGGGGGRRLKANIVSNYTHAVYIWVVLACLQGTFWGSMLCRSWAVPRHVHVGFPLSKTV